MKIYSHIYNANFTECVYFRISKNVLSLFRQIYPMLQENPFILSQVFFCGNKVLSISLPWFCILLENRCACSSRSYAVCCFQGKALRYPVLNEKAWIFGSCYCLGLEAVVLKFSCC